MFIPQQKFGLKQFFEIFCSKLEKLRLVCSYQLMFCRLFYKSELPWQHLRVREKLNVVNIDLPVASNDSESACNNSFE